MTLDDIGVKQDNTDKVQFIQDNNIPADEYISMDEFNVVVETLRETKSLAEDVPSRETVETLAETVEILAETVIQDGLLLEETIEDLEEIKQNVLVGSIATNEEAQIEAAPSEEDNKVVSRLKLFNWWQWVKSKAQSITESWTFTKSIIIGDGGYMFSDSSRFYIRSFTDKILNIGTEGADVDVVEISGNGVKLADKLTLQPGTLTNPPMVIPWGKLLTTPINGAVEADLSGIYYTINGVRRNLISEYVIDTFDMNNALVYLHGNGTVGLREEYYNLVTNSRLFNDGSANQHAKYTINISGIITRLNSRISDVKFEVQMQVSNSNTPDTWYTISEFEDIRENIIAATLPLQISLSAELLLQVLSTKFIYITGKKSNAISETFFKAKTSELSTSPIELKRENMLVSLRVKASVNWHEPSNNQDLLTRFGLIKMIKI